MFDESAILLAHRTKHYGAPTDLLPNRKFSHAIGRALNRPASVPVPGFVLDLKFGGEFGKVLRGGQRVMPRRALDLGYEFRYSEIDAAMKNLL